MLLLQICPLFSEPLPGRHSHSLVLEVFICQSVVINLQQQLCIVICDVFDLIK